MKTQLGLIKKKKKLWELFYYLLNHYVDKTIIMIFISFFPIVTIVFQHAKNKKKMKSDTENDKLAYYDAC
jgi:hypothetical protein